MKKITSFLCLGAVVFLVLAACAKPPTEEMDKAAADVTAAENDDDAVRYAGGALVHAKTLLDQMRAAADSKRYDEAKSLAAEASAAAARAISEGKAGAERARAGDERAKAEAENLLSSVTSAVEETGDLLKAAKTVQGINLDFNTLDKDMESAQTTVDAARLSLSSGDYQDSLQKSRGARASVSDIAVAISQATISVSRKK